MHKVIPGLSGNNDEEKIVKSDQNDQIGHDDEDAGCESCVGTLIWVISMILICCTFPLSLLVTVKQVEVSLFKYT